MFGISLGSLAIRALIVVVILAAVFGSGMYTQDRLDTVQIEQIKLNYADAEKVALQKAADRQKQLDDMSIASAQQESAHQAALAASVQAQLRKVNVHVKNLEDSRGCVTYGVIRVFDAAVFGVDADSLTLPAGKLDDSCSGLTADDLARSVVGNYGICRSNAEQLDALERWWQQVRQAR